MPANWGRLWRLAPPDLSPRARARLALIDWHFANGANVSRTARHFGWSRPTVYRWLSRYERYRLESLEDRSSRPHRRRRPTYTLTELHAVLDVRRRYPRWGKDKLAVVLRREGRPLAVSRIGRILACLRAGGDCANRSVGGSVRAGDPGADRMPCASRATTCPPHRATWSSSTRSMCGRWRAGSGSSSPRATWSAGGTSSSWRRATPARHAVALLDALASRMPFAVRGVSVDGGSEFMADSRQSALGGVIRLFVLPPRSPKLNGHVERANRTHTEEFYEVTDAEPELAAMRQALRAWETTYNTVRPHQSLGQLTPAEFLASLAADV